MVSILYGTKSLEYALALVWDHCKYRFRNLHWRIVSAIGDAYGSYNCKLCTYFTLSAIMRCFILPSAVEPHFDSFRFDILELRHHMPQRLQQAIANQSEQYWIGHFDVAGQIPAQMHHGHDALVALEFVPFVAFDAELILTGGQWSNIPRDVIAPANCLHPMHTAGIHPHQIAGPLDKTIHGNVRLVQIIEHRPPRSMQVIDIVFLAERLNATPVCVGHGKPLTITRTDVDIYRTEIIIFLMSGCPWAGHLHVQLYRIHTQNHVTDVRQHICSGYNTRESWQFLELLQLRTPFAFVREINVRTKSI